MMEEIFNGVVWKNAIDFWQNCLKSDNLPCFLMGDGNYCVNSLFDIVVNHKNADLKSCKANKMKLKYLLRIGYDGTQYFGFQRQGKDDIVRTVEGDLSNALKLTITAAGRTDRV